MLFFACALALGLVIPKKISETTVLNYFENPCKIWILLYAQILWINSNALVLAFYVPSLNFIYVDDL